MSPRTRVTLLVGAIAAAAAGAVVGLTLLQSEENEPAAGPRAGAPPLVLDLGVRDDPEAVALRRAERLYDQGRREAARRIFAGRDSLQARVGLAVADWPDGTVARLEQLARDHPRSAVVRLNLGFALFWSGVQEAAVSAWRAAKRVEPDSLAAVRADDLLHPDFPRGLPTFVPSTGIPAGLARLSPRRQLEQLRSGARRGGVRERLLYGVALQRLGRQLSARRAFDAAVAAAPDDVEARVAAAVGRFEKANPSAAFARLGPLAREHPRDPSVRFHLGLLLLWIGSVDEAKRQLVLARDAAPGHPLAREAGRFLRRVEEAERG